MLYQKSPTLGVDGGVPDDVERTPPPTMLPLALILPVTYSPVGDQTTTLPTPLTPTVILPPELTTVTLLLPLEIELVLPLVVIPVKNAPLPKM